MSFLNRIFIFMLVPVVCMLIFSCGQESDTSISSTNVQTIKWQLDGNGSVQFLTNDTQFYDYTFWNTYTQTNEIQMTTVTATAMKTSGCLNGGYGIVFCYHDSNNFYRLLIDATGQYSVYARVGGTYSVIVPWAPAHTALLYSGVGVTNVISVTQQSPNNFSVIFNGTHETTFSDGNFTGGTAGFSVGINQTGENFPNTPVDVRFKLSSPVSYP